MADTKKKVKKEEVNKKNTEEESEEIFLTKKAKKDPKEKSLASRIINVVLWVILFIWMGLCLIDFYNVHQEKEPSFCIKKETTKYNDGTVDSCLGLGYKIYNYKRTSYKAIEFGPFWSKDRSAEENK